MVSELQSTALQGVEDAFRSERLVYRAVEPTPEDTDFVFSQIQADPVNFALGSPGLLKPPQRKDAEWVISQVEKSLLGVIICLPPDEEGKGTAPSEEVTSGASDTPKPKSTPIGYLVLGWGGFGAGYLHHHRRTGLGITIATPFTNRGYGTEAIQWALEWAFVRCNLHSVSLGTWEYNTRAHKVYERVGFVLEGKNRQVHWHGGRYWDVLLYSMLEEEWKALYGKGK